jgi:hypothetical protein
MRRHYHGGLGSTPRRRTKKVRTPIRIKPIIAKKGGRCAGCRARYEVGDPVTVVRVKRRVFHTASCVPPGMDQIANVVGVGTAQPSAEAMPTTHGEAAMKALVHLENALVLRAKTQGITPEMEKSFDRYNKLKGMALRPGSDNEGRQAMKLATVELVKLVFA